MIKWPWKRKALLKTLHLAQAEETKKNVNEMEALALEAKQLAAQLVEVAVRLQLETEGAMK